MCNAWNHPPGCNCGWGGEGYLGGGGYREGIVSPTIRVNYNTSRISFRSELLNSLDSFVNPNATCPVCGASVFFYQSPEGGKVYFDSLGPPWPKHPCTDNESLKKQQTVAPQQNHNSISQGTDNWCPLIIKTIYWENGKEDSSFFKITGLTTLNNNSLQNTTIDLFVHNTSEFPEKATLRIFYIKSIDYKTIELSTFVSSDESSDTVKELRFAGYKYEQDIKNIIKNT